MIAASLRHNRYKTRVANDVDRGVSQFDHAAQTVASSSSFASFFHSHAAGMERERSLFRPLLPAHGEKSRNLGLQS